VTGEVVDITLTREEFVVPQVKGFERNKDNTWNFWVDGQAHEIGYIRLAQFTPDIGEKIEEITRQLISQNMKGLILDLRFNPGGRLEEAEQMIDLFVKEGVIVSVKGRNRPEQKRMAKAEGTVPDFPMVVLVNEHSASASEVVAGALKDNKRAIVVGARTYGKGSVQEVMPLDANAGELKMTVAYWYLPSGKRVQRIKDAKEWGVEPDYVVDMDDNAQTQLMREQMKAEQMRVTATVPVTNPASMPATGPATTQATTQATDIQLEKAIAVIREKLAAK
jgi:carboxyl-terminal processing protease